MTSVRTSTVSLPDGRELAVWEAGDPSGPLVVYNHGTPMSGLLYESHARDAEQRGFRLVGYSRPGYGVSTRRAGRRVADAAADAAALADAFGVERFATWGISGGGPHALACAALLGERVVAAASLAGVAPYDGEGLDYMAGMGEANIEEFGAVLAGEETLRPRLEGQAAELLATGEHALLELFASLVGPADRAVLHGRLAAYLHECDVVALAAGADGWIDDDLAFVAPWGFDVDAIGVPVLVLQGRDDRFVPFAHGEWLAAHVPGAEVRLTDEDGHLTLIERRVPAVHAWLLERF
jgi:pimeloyl-ACP methyl ester carboxylesterase